LGELDVKGGDRTGWSGEVNYGLMGLIWGGWRKSIWKSRERRGIGGENNVRRVELLGRKWHGGKGVRM